MPLTDRQKYVYARLTNSPDSPLPRTHTNTWALAFESGTRLLVGISFFLAVGLPRAAENVGKQNWVLGFRS